MPVLTETGGGTPMVFLNGLSTDSTEELAGKWCGDLLQIKRDFRGGRRTFTNFKIERTADYIRYIPAQGN